MNKRRSIRRGSIRRRSIRRGSIRRRNFGVFIGDKIGTGNQGDIYNLGGMGKNKYIIKMIRYTDVNSEAFKKWPKFLRDSFSIIKQKQKVKNEIDIQILASEIGIAPKILSYTDDYIIMEYIKGKTLKQYLKNHDYDEIKDKVVKAIKKMHNKGIIHNDLTYDNIMITNSGQVYIIDYGLAKISNDEEELESDTLLR